MSVARCIEYWVYSKYMHYNLYINGTIVEPNIRTQKINKIFHTWRGKAPVFDLFFGFPKAKWTAIDLYVTGDKFSLPLLTNSF